MTVLTLNLKPATGTDKILYLFQIHLKFHRRFACKVRATFRHKGKGKGKGKGKVKIRGKGKGKSKGKVHLCTDTEALYRPYGP